MNKLFIPIDVITGAPGSGKSDLLEEADRQFGEEAVRLGRLKTPKLMVIPEGAAILIRGRYPMPTRRFPHTQRWHDRFEYVNYAIHWSMEREIVQRARRWGCVLAVSDRSRYDILGYLGGSRKRYKAVCGVDPDDVEKDYDEVTIMQTLAEVDPAEYERIRRDRDTHRMEKAPEAVELGRLIDGGWANHRPRHYLPCTGSPVEKISQGIEILADRIRRLEAARS